MFETYLIYFLLLSLVLLAAKHYKRWLLFNNKSYLFISLFLLIIASLIIGFRYNVGTDWPNYKDVYESYLKYTDNFVLLELDFSRGYEPLYLMLNNIIALSRCSYQIYFTFTAFLVFICLFASFRVFPKYIIWGAFFFMTSDFLFTLNLHRQYLGVFIFLLFLPAIIENKKVKFISGVFLSSMFHYTNLITLFLAFLNHKIFSFLEHKRVAMLLVVVSFILRDFLTTAISFIVPYFGNEKYMGILDQFDITEKYNSGLGFIYKIFLSFLIIHFSDVIDKKYNVIYKGYLIGVILSNAFANSMFLGRVAISLLILQIYLLSIIVSYLYQNKSLYKGLALVLTLVPILGFVLSIAAGAAGCSPYRFKF